VKFGAGDVNLTRSVQIVYDDAELCTHTLCGVFKNHNNKDRKSQHTEFIR